MYGEIHFLTPGKVRKDHRPEQAERRFNIRRRNRLS
jgi:hypothetical protein